MIRTESIFNLLGKIQNGTAKGVPVHLLGNDDQEDFDPDYKKRVTEIPKGFVKVKEFSLLKNVALERVRWAVRVGNIQSVVFKKVIYIPFDADICATQQESRPKGYLTSKEASDILNKPIRFLQERAHEGRIKGSVKISRFWFFNEKEIRKMSDIINKGIK